MFAVDWKTAKKVCTRSQGCTASPPQRFCKTTDSSISPLRFFPADREGQSKAACACISHLRVLSETGGRGVGGGGVGGGRREEGGKGQGGEGVVMGGVKITETGDTDTER